MNKAKRLDGSTRGQAVGRGAPSTSSHKQTTAHSLTSAEAGAAAGVREALQAFAVAPLAQAPVPLGRITGAWGVKGWVKISPFSADGEALFHVQRWYLQAPPEGWKRPAKPFDGLLQLDVNALKPQGDALVAELQGVADRDSAQALRGALVALPRSEFPELEEGEFYWVDLLGLQVRNREGLALGVVADMLSNGPQSVLVVRADNQGADGDLDAPGAATEHLIPFVEAYVDEVDLPARTISVDWQPDYSA